MINKEFIEHTFSKGIPLIHAVGYFIAVEWYRSNYGSLTLLLSSVCSGRLVPVPSNRYKRYQLTAMTGPLERYSHIVTGLG